MLAQLLLGFILGLRHSADADHVVAVSGLLSYPDARRRHSTAARMGALWGLGHLLAVFLAGCVVMVLRAQIPPWLEWSLEFTVALVLLGIGVHALRNCFAGRYHFHFHQHGGPQHAHLHFHPHHQRHNEQAHSAHLPAQQLTPWRAPLALGMLHGLAGTASLTLLVLATISSPWMGAAYLLSFGFGALLGMAALSTVLNASLARPAAGAAWLRGVRLAAGVANCGLGLFLAARAWLPAHFPF
jgi:high-affinity nickel-transport protein